MSETPRFSTQNDNTFWFPHSILDSHTRTTTTKETEEGAGNCKLQKNTQRKDKECSADQTLGQAIQHRSKEGCRYRLLEVSRINEVTRRMVSITPSCLYDDRSNTRRIAQLSGYSAESQMTGKREPRQATAKPQEITSTFER